MNRFQKEKILTTFIRTKIVFKHRLKDLKDYDSVKLYVYELDKLGVNDGPLMWDLRKRKVIWYDEKGNFKILVPGPIDPSLLEVAKRQGKVSMPLTPLHVWMREQLRAVTIHGVSLKDIPVYFKAFLDNKGGDITPFFSVDTFSNRVHTPIVNLKGNLRFKIKFHGRKIVSLDVKQMQPTILAKVLFSSIGSNTFSDAIERGEDVYDHIQKETGSKDRSEAKKYLFRLIFGKPANNFNKVFNEAGKWVNWINEYKSREEPLNPHKRKTHTNLAWLLQYSEVQVMTGLWTKLMNRNIPFLTIHDEIICRCDDEKIVYDLMKSELKLHFKTFKINIYKN